MANTFQSKQISRLICWKNPSVSKCSWAREGNGKVIRSNVLFISTEMIGLKIIMVHFITNPKMKGF